MVDDFDKKPHELNLVLSTKPTSDKLSYVRLTEVDELGELLKAAVLAYLLGIDVGYAHRKYCKGRGVGVLWQASAQYLWERVRGGPEVVAIVRERIEGGGGRSRSP